MFQVIAFEAQLPKFTSSFLAMAEELVLTVDVAHTGLGMTFSQLRLSPNKPLSTIKEVLERKTGTSPQYMAISMISPSGLPIQLTDDMKSLSELGVTDGCLLEITDTDPASMVADNSLVDTSVAPKTIVSAKPSPGFAAFRKKNVAKKKPVNDATGADAAAKLSLGDRVQTKSGLVGVIRFIGRVEPLPAGFWVGVELDTPDGRNNGEVKGVTLFQCPENHGTVSRPSDFLLISADEEEL
jgi:hypothetical protein